MPDSRYRAPLLDFPLDILKFHGSLNSCFISSTSCRASIFIENGRGWQFAVFVNAKVSIGLLLSCEIRNAHRSSAVLIYNDRFATCNPGQTRLPKPNWNTFISSRIALPSAVIQR